MLDWDLSAITNGSALSTRTLIPSDALTARCSSKLKQLKHELQALVALTQWQVDVGADSAQGVQQGRQQCLQSGAHLCFGTIPFHVHTQKYGPGQLISLSGVGQPLAET